ncbi:ATP-binding protein [Streptomyces odontomachi]|uniref:ATP-binding protein n=1 Tax=Streptomyces odontomachi TaxID=2944940 RepID=UPI00210DF65E|nr:ATP-binding protein [Streptomyces sp. ODS25]
MSTTRPCSPGDRGPEPGAEGASEAHGEVASRDFDAAPAEARVGGPAAPLSVATAGSMGPGRDRAGPDRGDAETAEIGTADAGSAGPGPVVPVESVDGTGRRTRRISLRGASGVVPMARDFTRQALYAWGWLPAAGADQRAAAEDVLLVVSELVTNACLHAEGPEELWIGSDRKVLRLEVTDRGTGQPAPRTPHRAGRPGGHGMFIVQRLCLDWGVRRTPGVPGKTVWAELGAPS